jgi:predicted HicB family RNase H-like nuclease
MALTIQISDRIYERLRLLAKSQGVSLNKLVEEWATVSIPRGRIWA